MISNNTTYLVSSITRDLVIIGHNYNFSKSIFDNIYA